MQVLSVRHYLTTDKVRYLNSIIDFLDLNKIEYLINASMKKYTSFKIGGDAELMCIIKSCDELSLLLKYLNGRKIKPFIIGNGSNLLIKDIGISGVVIKLEGDFLRISADGNRVIAGAGASLTSLCRFALENELSGLEFAYGIPGTVGGAAYMNAGAYGGQMSDVVIRVNHINPDGSPGSLTADELDYGYRHSAYSNKDKVITTVEFELKKGNADEISNAMNDFWQRRKDKQPLNYPSAGSVFKRPEGYFAGALIEQSGLKGKSVGGAQVSEKHAGFIINKDNASCDDVLELIRICQDTVKNKFGVELECEIRLI